MKKLCCMIAVLGAFGCGDENERIGDAGMPISVVQTVPDIDATEVSVDTVVSAEFDAALEASSVNTDSFTLRVDDFTDVSGSVELQSSTLVLFTPDAPLASATDYTANLTTAIQTEDGRTLGADFAWSFSTATE